MTRSLSIIDLAIIERRYNNYKTQIFNTLLSVEHQSTSIFKHDCLYLHIQQPARHPIRLSLFNAPDSINKKAFLVIREGFVGYSVAGG